MTNSIRMKNSHPSHKEPEGRSKSQLEFILGGTFDPIHHGHLAMIEQLVGLDARTTIRLIPCAVPALKSEPGATFKQRCDMLHLAVGSYHQVIVDEREAQRDGASYTIDTLKALKSEFPDKVFVLVIGADNAVEIEKWHRWRELSESCHLLVLNRPGNQDSKVTNALTDSGFKLVADFNEMKSVSKGLALYHQMSEKKESSTQIRQSAGESGLPYYMLPESVIEYIRKNRLYTGENS